MDDEPDDPLGKALSLRGWAIVDQKYGRPGEGAATQREAEAAESALRASLARIRAVVAAAEALELQSIEGGHTNRALWPALSALTADDRRLLGMG